MCLYKLPTAKLIIFAVLQSLLIFPKAHVEDLETHTHTYAHKYTVQVGTLG